MIAPISCLIDKAGANRVEGDVAQGCAKMCLIQRPRLRPSWSAGARIRCSMIGHQYPSLHLNINCLAVYRQQIAIKSVIGVAKKRPLTTIPTLRHVMWYPRDDKASETIHAQA